MALEKIFSCPRTLARLQGGPLGKLLEGFCRWLMDYGFSRWTIRSHLSNVSHFNAYLGTVEDPPRESVTAQDVDGFLRTYPLQCGNRGPLEKHLRSVGWAINRFVDYLRQKGLFEQSVPAPLYQPLDQAVPTLRTYRLCSVPRAWSEGQAQKILEAVERSSPVGLRDYAIVLLLHTFGVRSGQVRALRLEDIHWSENRILFRAMKNGKDTWLPLSAAVGEALLGYLQQGRPACACPQVFLTARAPYRPLRRSSKVAQIVRDYAHKAGIDAPPQGAHAFPHAFATRMLRQGHSLKAIAEVLGHRRLSTTFLYTKVDFDRLEEVVLAWPREAPSC